MYLLALARYRDWEWSIGLVVIKFESLWNGISRHQGRYSKLGKWEMGMLGLQDSDKERQWQWRLEGSEQRPQWSTRGGGEEKRGTSLLSGEQANQNSWATSGEACEGWQQRFITSTNPNCGSNIVRKGWNLIDMMWLVVHTTRSSAFALSSSPEGLTESLCVLKERRSMLCLRHSSVNYLSRVQHGIIEENAELESM